MNDKQWVCHISGQGEKWEVLSGNDFSWTVYGRGGAMCLPTCEYRLCDPPEVWRDVTEQVEDEWIAENVGLPYSKKVFSFLHNGMGMGLNVRLRKVQLWKQYEGRGEYKDQWAFIVEKKVSQ